MPKLLKFIEGEIFQVITDDIIYNKSITGEIQNEDYINLNGFIAFLQNFSKIEDSEILNKPIIFGLKNKNNIPLVTLIINF